MYTSGRAHIAHARTHTRVSKYTRTRVHIPNSRRPRYPARRWCQHDEIPDAGSVCSVGDVQRLSGSLRAFSRTTRVTRYDTQ